MFEEGSYAAQMVEAAINVITPVMESTAIYAGKYAKACDRDFITGEDMKYAMRYCARTMVGKHSGSLFPEIYDSDESDEEIETFDEDDEHCFTRYSGDDKLMNEINDAYDTWDEWEPQNPMEKMLQDAVNKNN